MPRIADDILIGGGRVFLDGHEIGWLQGDVGLEEQSNSLTVKESEGATVLTIPLDKEVHFTFSLLEANLDTLRMLNPSYTQVVYGDADVSVTGEWVQDLGKSNGLRWSPVVEGAALHVWPATTMTSGITSGASTVLVENARRFAAGDAVELIKGATVEAGTVSSVDATTGTIELTSGLLNPFPAGTAVKIATASKEMELGTDYWIYPALGLITRASASTDVLAGDGCVVDYTYRSAKGRGYGMGSFDDGTTYKLEFWHKKRSGKFRCIRMFKAKISGNFSAFALSQDNESPIPIDVTLMADETIADTRRNIYEQIEYDATAAPGGGW